MCQNFIFLKRFAVFIACFLTFVRVSSSQELPCDPFDIGTNAQISQMAQRNGELNPNNCLCTNPCTVNKVVEFVRFYYIKRGDSSYSELDIHNPTISKLFNYRRSLKFLLPGYTEPTIRGWIPPTGIQLTRDFNGYVILVDFEPILNCSYQRTVQEIIPSVALFVSNVIRNFNFNPQKIELIGHSLGGHLAGYIGASFNGAMKRITALDPAGPGYDDANIGLNRTCAQFVQVLHTTPGLLGTALLRGDADFFANNRSEIQPGCTVKACGHGKAIYYYFASLFRQNKFISGDCGLLDVTQSQYTTKFGQFNDGKSGVFCFETTPCFPYAQTIQLYRKCRNCKNCRKCKNCNRSNKCSLNQS